MLLENNNASGKSSGKSRRRVWQGRAEGPRIDVSQNNVYFSTGRENAYL